MKFSKLYIKQLIREEATNYINMKKKLKSRDEGTKLDALRRDLIDLFIKYRQKSTSQVNVTSSDEKEALDSELKLLKSQYGLNHLSYIKFFMFAFHILQGRVDPQLLTFIKSAAKRDARFAGHHDKLDNYGMSSTPEEEKNSNQIRDPDPDFMRVPKSDNAVSDQEDLRKYRRN